MLFSNKEYKREGDTLDMEEKGRLKKLLDDRDKYLDRAFELDQKIVALEESTKTLVPAMTPVHNYLRMKFKWYYNWHMKPYAHKVHWTILGVSMSAMMLGIFFSVSVPNPVEKTVGATGCTTTKTGVWSDVTVWTGCNNTPPRFDDVTIANNVTVDTAVGITGSLTISNGITLDTSGTQDISVSQFINNGTFTPGNSTVIFIAQDGLTLTSGNITFNNVSVGDVSLTEDRAVNIGSGVLTINGNLSLSTGGRVPAPAYTVTYTMGNNITVTGTTTITNGGGGYARSKLDTKSGSNYTLTTGVLTIASGSTLVANASAINVTNGNLTNSGTITAGSSIISIAGSFSPGTFTYGTSTIKFTGAGSYSIAQTTYYNLTIDSGTYKLTGSFTAYYIYGDLVVNGTLNSDQSSYTTTVIKGNITGTGTINFASDTSNSGYGVSWDINGNRSLGSANNANAWNFGNFSIASSTGTPTVTKQSTADITVKEIRLGSNYFGSSGQVAVALQSNSTETWTITGVGSSSPMMVSPTSTFNPEHSTIKIGASGTMAPATFLPIMTYYNLTVENPSANTDGDYTFAVGIGGGGPPICFLGGTKVLTDKGEKNIEDITKDDQVISYNPETKSLVNSKVIATISKDASSYYKINNKVSATGNHIFILDDGSKKPVDKLQIGDTLATKTGTEIITSINKIDENVSVYDITIDGSHLFYANDYLVHNAGLPVTVTNTFRISKAGATGANVTTDGTNVSNYSFGNLTIDSGNTFTVGTIGGSPVPLTITGNIANSGTFTNSSGTVTFAGTSGTQQINMGGTGAGQKFKNIVVNNAGATAQLVTNNMTMDTSGTITMTAGTFDLNGLTLTLAGSLTTAAGTLAIGTGTLAGASYDLTVNSGGTVTQGTGTANFTNLTVGSGGTYTCTGNSAINLSGNLSVHASSTFGEGTSTITTSGTSKDIGSGKALYNLTIGGGTHNISTALDINGNLTNGVVLTASGGITTMSIAGNLTNNSTMPSGFTYTFDGSSPATQSLKLGTYTGSIVHSGTSTLQLATSAFLLTGSVTNSAGTLDTAGLQMTVSGDLTMNGGTLSNSTGTANITVNGNINGAGGTINLASGTLTQRIGTAKTFGTTSGSVDWTFNNLTLTNSSAGNLAVTANTGGTGKFITTGTLTVGSGSDTNTTTLDCATNNRTVDAVNLTIASKGSFTAPSTLTVSGNLANSGTFTPGSSTLTIDGTNTALNMGSSQLNNFNNNLSGTLTLGSALIINGNFTNTTGTFVQGDYDITVKGNFIITAGTYNDGTGDLWLTGENENIQIDAKTQSLGILILGASPHTFTLVSDLGAATLTVNENDTLLTNGYEVTVLGDTLVNGTLNATDNGEGNGSIISTAGNFTISVTGTFVKSLVANKRSNITLNPGAAKNFTSGGEDMGDVTLATANTHIDLQDTLNLDTMFIGVGTTLDANHVAETSFDITVSGNWLGGEEDSEAYGTYKYGTNTTIFDGSDTQTTRGLMNNVTHTGSGRINFASASEIVNFDNMAGGPLSFGTIFVYGDWLNNGAITSSGMLIFQGKPNAVDYYDQTFYPGGLDKRYYAVMHNPGYYKHQFTGNLILTGDLKVYFLAGTTYNNTRPIMLGSNNVIATRGWNDTISTNDPYYPTIDTGTSTVTFTSEETPDGIVSTIENFSGFHNLTIETDNQIQINTSDSLHNPLIVRGDLVVNDTGIPKVNGVTQSVFVGSGWKGEIEVHGNMTGDGLIDLSNYTEGRLIIHSDGTKNLSLGTAGNTNKWKFKRLEIVNSGVCTNNGVKCPVNINKLSANDIDIKDYLTIGDNVNLNLADSSTETWTVMSNALKTVENEEYAIAVGLNSDISPALSTFIVKPSAAEPTLKIGAATYYNLSLPNDGIVQTANIMLGLDNASVTSPTYDDPPLASPPLVLVDPPLCLLAGTKVTTPNGLVDIESITKGVIVTSYDKYSKKLVNSNVVKTIKQTASSYYVINNKISATGNHIFILSDGSRKVVDNLRLGDILATKNGTETINNIEKVNKQVDVYDISLDRSNLFYANGYLVHNAGGILQVLSNLLISKTGNNASAKVTGSGTNVNGVVVNNNLTVLTGTTYDVGDKTTTINGSVTINSGGTLKNGSGILNVTGDFTNNGTYTPETGTLNLSGTSNQSLNTAGTSIYNLSHNGSSTLIANTNDVTVTNNFSNTGGTVNLNGKNMTVTGNYTNTANITPGSGTITFNGSGTQSLNSGGTASGKQFGNLTHSGSGKVQLVSNNLQVNGNLVNSTGTFDANGLDIFAYKNWDFGGGTFYAGATPAEQTVFMYGDDAATFVGNTTFNNLIFENSSSKKAISFTAGSKQTVNKEISLDGDLSLASTKAGTQWQFSLADNYYFDAPLTVTDSKINDPYKVYAGTTVTDGGNNTNWIFGYTGITSSISRIKSIKSPTISFNPPANFNIEIDVGEGGKYLRGKIIITDLFGNVVETITLNEKLAKDSLGKFNFKWNYPWWRIGVYKVQVLAAYGAKEDAVNNVSYIFIIPWWLLIVLFGVLAPLLYWLARKYAYKSIIKRLMTTKYSKIKKEETAPVNEPHDYDS